jgi:hypothetical protein
MNEHFITVYRSINPVEAEIIENMLREEGFTAHLIGTRTGALIGVSDLILRLRIEVPEAESEAAAALVQDLLNSERISDVTEDAEDGAEDHLQSEADATAHNPYARDSASNTVAMDDMDDDEKESDTAEKRRVRAFAGMACILFPGGAHIYLHRYLVAVALIFYFMSGAFLLFSGHGEMGVVFMIGAYIMDLLVSQMTFPSPERTEPLSAGMQFVFALLIGIILSGTGYVLTPVVPNPNPVATTDSAG